MRPKIIKDELLLAMVKEGKDQKAAADFFGVSEAAISKRLKRLISQPLPKSLENLTEKEQKFVIEKVKGKSNVNAVMEAYDVTSRESAKAIGTQLMAKPEIQMAINELMDYHGLTKSYRVEKIKQHVDNRDPVVSLKALDMTFKLDGSYAPEKSINLNINYAEMSKEVEELEKAIALYEAEHGEPEYLKRVRQGKVKQGDNNIPEGQEEQVIEGEIEKET